MVGRGALLLALAGVAGGVQAADVPEPPGLWRGEMVSDTPATLQGAQVIDVAALERLLRAPRPPLLVDVGPADRRPEGLPAEALWKPVHRSIPGAVWFPGAGRADLPDERAQALLARIDRLSHGDRTTPLVTFCKPRCWGSWNAGKRLVQAGYTAVHWFPGGVHAWQEQHETTALEPEAGWNQR